MHSNCPQPASPQRLTLLGSSLVLSLLLGACSWHVPPATQTSQQASSSSTSSSTQHNGRSRQRYKAPLKQLDWAKIPDAIPRWEPITRAGNPPVYEIFGVTYQLLPSAENYDEQGIASWYGPKFHGRRTSNGEIYDMYAMTAAHKTLPIPSYARVTNLKNGKQIVVRINDRGPFIAGRIIDLSYTAAHKLDMTAAGTVPVRVTSIVVTADGRVIEADKQAQKLQWQEANQRRQTTPRPNAQPRLAIAEQRQGDILAATLPPANDVNSKVEASVFGSGQLYIQTGSFLALDSAEAHWESLRTKQYPAEVIETIVMGAAFYRVRVGPFTSMNQARKTIDELNRIGLVDTFITSE